MAGKILLIEDDADLSLALSVWLQGHGYRVVKAMDSITALGAARREEPDVILLDLGLPGGGGVEFLTRLRSLTNLPYIPVIVITARDASHQETALQAGAQAVLQKPVDNDELLTLIREQLGIED